MKIYFVGNLPNYLDNPRPYFSMGGCNVVAYYYWILYNAGIKDICLHSNPPEGSTVVFHSDMWRSLRGLKNTRFIQVMLDRHKIEGCEHYVACDPSANDYFIYQPLPYGLVPGKPQWPPKNFRYIGSRHACANYLESEDIYNFFVKNGLTFSRKFGRWTNFGDENVVIGPRRNTPWAGHKSSAKLHTAWALGVPSILSPIPSIEHDVNDEFDSLLVDNIDEFKEAVLRLVQDEDLYNKMTERARERSVENTHQSVVDQWKGLL